MRIDLSKDPKFGRIQSPLKQIKDKRLQKQKQMRIQRMNPTLSQNKIQIDIEIYDPLPIQLKTYREDTRIKRLADNSKASRSLKKYIIEQQRNLKYLRLDRIQNDEKTQNKSKLQSSTFRFEEDQKKQNKRGASKQINIPKINQLFKDQEKQFVLYESKVMKNKLANAINSIQKNVIQTKPKSHYKSASNSFRDTKKGVSFHETTNHKLSKTISELNHVKDEDLQLNQLIQRKMQRSQKLRKMLGQQKKAMLSNNSQSSEKSKGIFMVFKQKPKKKVKLEGIKQIPIQYKEQQIQVTPASSLLFELNHLYKGRQQKQIQLSGLLKNSYQNRDDILLEKSTFYEEQNPFSKLSPSNQFKLRKQMNKKLDERLILSREQITSFVNYIIQIKQVHHVILNKTILQILQEIRESLISGKVMKKSDLMALISTKDKDQLQGKVNEKIVKKLYEMMI